MKSKLFILGSVLVLSALIITGCGPATAQPTEVPTATPTEVAVQAPDDVRAALDSALAYVNEHYGEQAPPPSLTWTEEDATPEGLIGWATYKFTAEDWVVTIGHAVVPPQRRVYRTSVSNPTTGFWWEGRIDVEGLATEGPEIVLTARGAALSYVSEHYGEQAPAPDLTWEGGRATPEGLVGDETFQYTAEDWMVTITYPVVAPENVVYHIVVANPTTGFQWEGELDAERYLTETAAPEGYIPPEVVLDRIGARDAALSYIYKQYRYPPVESLYWEEERITPGGMVGTETYRYTAFDWVVEISYNVVAPEAMIYQVRVTNPTLGLDWQGEVDAAGQVTEASASSAGQPVVGWLGRVVSLPAGGQFDDYLILEPAGASEIGVECADNTVAAQIQMLRDSTTYAHFWGTLTCPVLDYGGCQLVVTRLREDRPGPSFHPDPVEGWEGTIVSFPPGSQFDDYFRLAGDFPVGYGIERLDPAIAAQLEGLRDTGATIRVWGELVCPAIDAFGTEIVVNRIEVIGQPAPAPTPAPAPVPTPAPTPVASWTEPLENWWGEIVSYPRGSQYDDYFQRQIVDGGQYGIESRDPEIQAQIVALRDTGTTVHVWGTLYHDVPDVNATQILVTRLEVQEIPTPPAITEETVEGWVGTIIKYPLGFQCDDYFERNDGQQFGIEAMSADTAVRQQIEQYRWMGAQVQVWGKLVTGIPDVENRQIQVERIEALSGPAEEARNLMPFATASASSYLPTDRGGQYQSWMAMDGSLETSWVEGVAGPGVGEWFMLTFPGTVEIYYINIDVGYDRDADIFYANNRIKRVTFVFSNGEQIEMPLSDTRGMQMIALARAPGPSIETTFVKMVIEEVYPGSRHDDTCLAEIEVWGKAK